MASLALSLSLVCLFCAVLLATVLILETSNIKQHIKQRLRELSKKRTSLLR